MFANHPEIAREFARKTRDIAGLPEHARKKKKDERPAVPRAS